MFKQEQPNDEKKQMAKKIKGPKGQTKAEQEAILERLKSYAVRDPEITANNIDFSKPLDEQGTTTEGGEDDDVKKEVMRFQTPCYSCDRAGEAKMCIASIPFFKEIIIMAFSCDFCGYRSTDIKQGGGISDKATKIVLKVENPADLNRDVFKSDTCMVAIPEVDFAMAPGSLGSLYTTIEGLLSNLIDKLQENNPFGMGDSKTNNSYLEFIEKLRQLKEGNKPFTLILDDPASNCFIYNPFAPENDPKLEITVYERTWEQDEELGINDMKVNN